jgi:hypothetical protein
MKVRMSSTAASFETDFPSVWHILQDIRAVVRERLADAAPEVRDATILVASELAENLLKYAAEGEVEPLLAVDVSLDFVVVRTENDVEAVEHADEVLAIVERIEAHADPFHLYAEAIDARLGGGAKGGTQQGFYRIAAVGEFRIAARKEGLRLFITAERATR